jgi:manganese/zinc/iron transport system permease protein
MVLSVYFGVGILMLTAIQKSGAAAQAGLDKYLFGQAASLVGHDVWVISTVGAIICGAVMLGYKELKVLSFDPEFAAAIGMPRRLLEMGLATLIVLAVAIGLQAVGVVLMAAMLVTPAAAARYWTDRLHVMLALSAAFGAVSGLIGAYVSYLSTKMPTGPWMVVAVTSIFLVSILCAPRRGILPRLIRHWRYQRRTARENVLRTLYLLGERQGDWRHAYTTGELLQYRNMSARVLERTLERLRRGLLVNETSQGHFALSAAGRDRAARITRLHRLWEVYLTRKLELAPDHVHDDAEEIEHIITPELEARLVAAVGEATFDPHHRAIPGSLERGGA